MYQYQCAIATAKYCTAYNSAYMCMSLLQIYAFRVPRPLACRVCLKCNPHQSHKQKNTISLMICFHHMSIGNIMTFECIIQIYSRITCSRVLNGELHAQRLQKLIYLYLLTDYFIGINLRTKICSDDWREFFMKQSVNKFR